MPMTKYPLVAFIILGVGLSILAGAECWEWSQIAPPCMLDLDAGVNLAYDRSRQNLVLLLEYRKPSDHQVLWRYNGHDWQLEWEGTIDTYLSDILDIYFDDRSGSIMAIGFRSWDFEQGAISAYQYEPGKGWTRITQVPYLGPSNLNPRVTYDTTRQKAIIISVSWLYSPVRLTAEFNGTTFTYVEQPDDIVFSNGALGYDPYCLRTVFYGKNLGSDIFASTYEYDGTGWQKIETSQSPPQNLHAALGGLTYSADLNGLVGILSDPSVSETWLYKENNWTKMTTYRQPSPRIGPEMVFDEERNAVLIFGGFQDYSFCESWQLASTKHCRPVSRP